MEDHRLEERVRDEKLLARAKVDPRVIGEIYDLYADRLYGFLLKRCGHKETAEDLVAKTFLKFIEALPNITWQGVTIGAWLYRSSSNALIDYWRSATHRLDAEIDEDFAPPSKDKDPAWYTEQELDHAKLLEAMKTLSARDQHILDLHFFGQYETPEIATEMNITANHASVLVYRALGRLRTKYLILIGSH